MGIPVFPCTKEKKPLTPHGFKDASTDLDTINQWWTKHPDALIGMPTGDKNGITVLDVDLPNGEKSLAELEAEYGALPSTTEVRTQSGGRHIYFKYVEGIKSTAGKLGKNLDIRNDGGYAIVPPSSGYTFVKGGTSISHENIADCPAWLEDILFNPKKSKEIAYDVSIEQIPNALTEICAKMAQAPKGERNDTLNRFAYLIGKAVAIKEMPTSAIEKLKEVALESGLPHEEVEKTSQSGYEAGLKAVKNSNATNFYSTDEGIFYSENPEKKEPKFIAPPMDILAKVRDKSSNNWGILAIWKDPDGKEHKQIIYFSILMDNNMTNLLSMLGDGGYIVENPSQFRVYLKSYTTNQRAVSVDRTGWYEGSFVLPDIVYYDGNVGIKEESLESYNSSFRYSLDNIGTSELIILQTQITSDPYKVGGTFESWQNTVARWAKDNARLILAICAAFTPLLLKILGHENYGLNIVGKSSSGKSTALQAGSSVWGKGSTEHDGYASSWNSTGNGIEGIAALHSDTLLALDEMGQASARTISETTYMLANGVGKTRARKDGSAKEPKKWRCVILSTSEKGVAEKIGEDGKQAQAGQLVRIIDVPADAGEGYGLFECLHEFDSAQAFADAIKQSAITDYGHAAREFIKFIQKFDDIKFLRDRIEQLVKILLPKCEIDSEVNRVAGHFAITALAGELATEFGIVNWCTDEPLNAIQKCFDAWLEQRGGTKSAEETNLVDKVKSMILQHGSSRFQDIDAEGVPYCPNRLGFKKLNNTSNGKQTEYYVTAEIFKKEISNSKEAAKILYKNGLLIKGEGNNYMRKVPRRLPDIGVTRWYVLVLPDEYKTTETEDEERREKEEHKKHVKEMQENMEEYKQNKILEGILI